MTSKGLSRRTVLKKGAVAAAALTIGTTASTGAVSAGVGNGRVGHYTLNNLHLDRSDHVRNMVHDASPFGNDGENHCATVVDGVVGNAFAFDGEEDYVEVPDDESLDLTDALTISFWFRLTGTSADNAYPRAVSKGQSTTSNGAYGVFIEDGNGSPTRIGLRFIDESGTKHDVECGSLSAYDDGEWHHVVATYSNADDEGRLYFDGTMVSQVSIGGDVSIRTTDDPLHIGDGNGERHLAGELDEVRIYDRALSDPEIGSLTR